MSFKSKIKDNRLVRGAYDRLKYEALFDPDDLLRAAPRPVDSDRPRLNLALLGIAKKEVFGGVSTALDVFGRIAAELGCDERIIVTGRGTFDAGSTYVPEGFEHDRGSSKSLVFLAEDPELDVRPGDVFTFTYWTTRFSLSDVVDAREAGRSGRAGRDVYLIQDFEPGFFAWSSDYALAESTYLSRPEGTIALFNSHQLRDFFFKRGYGFSTSYCFDPVLNRTLKGHLLTRGGEAWQRDKLIIFYGRPSQGRNAFAVVRSALRLWSREYPKAHEWQVVSLGESYPGFRLQDGYDVEVPGKVTLDQYADYLQRAFAGISLMVSPHPSYPPLEMATFGVRTITNSFECKDLGGWAPDITSLATCTPQAIADRLAAICDEYYECGGLAAPQLNDDYLADDCISGVVDGLVADLRQGLEGAC